MDAASATDAYSDRRHGFSLEVPPGWGIRKGVAGLLVSLVAPNEDASAFKPNLNVVRKVRDTRSGLDELARDAVATLNRLLTDLIVIDLDSEVVADLPARRVLVAYRQGSFALVSEQWLLVTDEFIWTISAGAAADQWDAMADEFSRVVRSLRLDP